MYIEADEQAIEALNISALTTTRGLQKQLLKTNDHKSSYEQLPDVDMARKRGSNVTYNHVTSETDQSQIMLGHLPQLMTAQDFFHATTAKPERAQGKVMIKRNQISSAKQKFQIMKQVVRVDLAHTPI